MSILNTFLIHKACKDLGDSISDLIETKREEKEELYKKVDVKNIYKVTLNINKNVDKKDRWNKDMKEFFLLKVLINCWDWYGYGFSLASYEEWDERIKQLTASKAKEIGYSCKALKATLGIIQDYVVYLKETDSLEDLRTYDEKECESYWNQFLAIVNKNIEEE